MAASRTIQLTYSTREAAMLAYVADIARREIRTKRWDDLSIGTRVDVAMDLPFAGWGFRVGGEVRATSVREAVVQLDPLPAGIRSLFHGEHAPETVRADSTAPPAVDEDPDDGRGSIVSVEDDEDSFDESLDGDEEEEVLHFAPDDFESTLTTVDEDGRGIPLPDEAGRRLLSVARFQGDLRRDAWSSVLLAILRDHLSGVLVVEGRDHLHWLYCLDGFPVHVERRPETASAQYVERLALEGDLLDPEVARRSRYLAQITGRTTMSVVTRLQLLDFDILGGLRERDVSDKLHHVLTNVRGPYAFYAVRELEQLFQHTPAAVVETLVRWAHGRRELTRAQATEVAARHADQHVYLTFHGERVREHLAVDRVFDRVLDRLVDQDLTIGQVIDGEDGDSQRVLSIVLALHDLGLVDRGAVPDGPLRRRLEAERLVRGLHGRIHLDHFGVLGCHWADDPPTLERAMDHAMSILEALPAQEGEPVDLASIRRSLLQCLQDTSTVLLNSGLRADYRGKHVSPAELRMAAVQRLQEGALALHTGRAADARASLRMALELDPTGSVTHRARVNSFLQRLASVDSRQSRDDG